MEVGTGGARAQWPPIFAPNATWHDVVALQLRPWRMRGSIDVAAFLRETNNLRSLAHPPNAAVVDSDGWRVLRVGARWVGHHAARAEAVLNLFRLAQRRALRAGRPLPRIRFVLVLSDGHGATARGFNASGCTCTRESTCEAACTRVDAPPSDAPAAPSFATLHCRHSFDVSVPTIIDDLLKDTRTTAGIDASIHKWLAMGEARPWDVRERRAFFVGDDKAHRPKVIRAGQAHSDLLATHRAVSTDPRARLPFGEHTKYKAAVYAHGFHFNSVRWRRLALLGGAVIAPEGPCKEWWQMLARPWVHYAPTTATFSDLPEVAKALLHPSNDRAAHAMANELRDLALRSFRPPGLLEYIDTLWRAYAELQHLPPSAASREPASRRPSSAPSSTSSWLGEAWPSPSAPLAPRRAGSLLKNWLHGGLTAKAWRCTSFPANASVGGDEARCLYGNRRNDGHEYGYNRKRGTRQAMCSGPCTCCRRVRRAQGPEGSIQRTSAFSA